MIEGDDKRTGMGDDWLEGDTKLRKGIRAVFVKNVPAQMQKVRDALANNDVRGAELLSHSIKGAAAMIGAAGLKEAAHETEQACVRGDAGRAGELLFGLGSEFQKVMDELNLEIERKQD